MSRIKRIAVAVAISLSFFFSDVVYAQHAESTEKVLIKPPSTRLFLVIAEKYSRVADTLFNKEGEMMIVQVEQRTIVLKATSKPDFRAHDVPKRKPGHTHEETRHEIEKIGPDEEEEI